MTRPDRRVRFVKSLGDIFQGSDPNAHDNRWLHAAHELGLPLID